MIVSVHQPQYLPWLGYFDKIRKSDAFVFLDNVQYKKREFQNRNRIRTREGWMWLTLPVITRERYLQKISEVELDNGRPWAADHWKSIECNYARAPFFSVCRDVFAEMYRRPWTRLIDINIYSVHAFLKLFDIRTPVYLESDLGIETTSTQRIIDICKKLGADTYLSGAGGKDYMDESLFPEHGITLAYQEFTHPVYRQCFDGFEPCMSALDFLINCGPSTGYSHV